MYKSPKLPCTTRIGLSQRAAVMRSANAAVRHANQISMMILFTTMSHKAPNIWPEITQEAKLFVRNTQEK